jgi:two-component system, OmpR family, sensor histidine kinase SenX3
MDFATFVAAAAHDMKNSVSVISAYLDHALAQMGPGTTPSSVQAAQLTQQALYEAQRVNGHLVQLMAIYKLDRGMYPFEPEEVDLQAFADEAMERIGPLARTKGLALECLVDDTASSTWFFDRDLVLSVIVQALFNAVRYTRSRVSLSIRSTPAGLEIAVQDDGGGYPAFMLEQGFAVQGVDPGTGSTGLGLYFAHAVARLHKRQALAGNTELRNLTPEGGGWFIFTLP